MWIIIKGNPLEGFTYHGPFTNTEDAIQWASDARGCGLDWWLIKLEDPNSQE